MNDFTWKRNLNLSSSSSCLKSFTTGVKMLAKTQFIPFNGIYVVARQYQGKTVLTILNGTSEPATFDVSRYAEIIGNATKAKDILTDHNYDLSENQELKPRQSLILEF